MKDRSYPLTIYDPDGELKRKLEAIGKIEKRSKSNLAQMFILQGIEKWQRENKTEVQLNKN